MSEKKYELTDETKESHIRGKFLHRIRALRNFGTVTAGDLGGWIEKEENLSHEGECWVYNNAIVCDSGLVCDNARAYGNSMVCGYGSVRGNAIISGCAIVRDNSKISDNVVVTCHAIMQDNSRAYEFANIGGHVIISEHAIIRGRAKVGGNAKILWYAEINGMASIYGDVEIRDDRDIITISGLGPKNYSATFMRDIHNNLIVNTIGFNGNVESFKEYVVKKYGNESINTAEYLAAVEFVKTILRI